jgi:hypothetical protein
MTLFSRQQRADDETLKSYLLGGLPQDATERLDELSVVDDEVAARLATVESDLVDAYVRRELSGDTLKKFEGVYLASSLRRERVKFAESLYAVNRSQRQAHSIPARAERFSWTGLFGVPRLALAGGLAMLLVISVLVIDNLQLRRKIDQTAAERAASQKRESGVQTQLKDQHAENDAKSNEPQSSPASPAATKAGSIGQQAASQVPSLPVSVAAFMLAPQMRGATQIPDLTLPHTTTQAAFRLDLESNDFPRYQVTLINMRSEKVLWHSANLKAVTKGENSTVSANIPAKLLQPEIYQLDLAGVSANGESEFVSSYVFKIETR